MPISRWVATLLPIGSLLLLLSLSWFPQKEQRSIHFSWLDQQVPHDHWWIFFGYMTCHDICPDTLAKMRQAYEQLPANSRPGVVMIDTTTIADSVAITRHVQAFHPHFQAYVPSKEVLGQLQQQFGVRIIPRPEEEGSDHSGAIYQVERVAQQWILTRTFQDADPIGLVKESALLEKRQEKEHVSR